MLLVWNIAAALIFGFFMLGVIALFEVDDKYKTTRNYTFVFVFSLLVTALFIY